MHRNLTKQKMETKLTEDQKDYIVRFRLWHKSQDLLISNEWLNLKNAQDTIALSTKKEALSKETIEVETKFTKNGFTQFEKWCSENNIDPYIVLT